MWPFVLTVPPNGQPHTVFGGSASISGGWILLYKELIIWLKIVLI